jgi:hypothetical protein
MADLRKRQPGESLTIPAADWNAAMDAARDFRERQNRIAAHREPVDTDSGIVLVKNTSGSDVDRFGILGIDTILFTPAEHLQGFKNSPVLKGVTPAAAHVGKFVITAEPIGNNRVGRAHIQGVCPVKIDVVSGTPTAADIKVGSRTVLSALGSGAAQVLYVESGTGEKWAVVRLGAPASAEFPAIITGSASLASATVAVNGGSGVTVIYRWKYAWSEAELNGDLWQIKSGGRSGTTTTNYALNDLEDFHTGAINWNATITAASYPRGHRDKPVGGASADTNQTHSYNVPVRMRSIVDINGNVKYRFSAPGGHFGLCT